VISANPDAADRPARSWPAWFDDATEAPATLRSRDSVEGERPPEVLVIGLGASGLEAVRWMARRGVDVMGIDAGGVAAGAAGANGGFLLAGLAMFHHVAVATLGREAAVGWYRRTLDELDQLAEEEPTFDRRGSRRTAASDEERTDIAAHLAALRADGLPAEADGDGGLLVPGDGVVHPVDRCRRLAREAVDAGARLVAPAPVRAVVPGRALLADDAGSIEAPRILLAVDGGLLGLVPSLRGSVRGARLQMLATDPDEGVELRTPRYHRLGLDYVHQRPDGRVLLGGGRDIGGAREHEAPPEPSEPVQRHLDGWLRSLGVTAAVTHRWAARVSFTQDLLPIDAQVMPGVHAVGAYSGHGNVLGGLLARQAAARALAS
jgi:gamma-glutamylputrescine oxidase